MITVNLFLILIFIKKVIIINRHHQIIMFTSKYLQSQSIYVFFKYFLGIYEIFNIYSIFLISYLQEYILIFNIIIYFINLVLFFISM